MLKAPVLRYAIAMGVLLIASLLSSAVSSAAGRPITYLLLVTAISFCAWYCGPGPSVIAVALGLIETRFGFVPRVHSFSIPTRADWICMLAFVLASAMVIIIGESRRRENLKLLKAQSELENKVQERTADLDSLNRNLRQLSARLMQLQDDERRRIARELHDSVGQMLAALAMNLSAVRTDVEQLARTTATLIDSETLVQDMSAEVRTISHLLHPPLLDEAGLLSAIRWYVEGYSQRSRIAVELDLPDNFGRLPSEMETAVFRVVQECLTNVHRHSGSAVARIRLRRREDHILVQIEDKGRGIPPEKQLELATHGKVGVGIRGMRERLRQLGGTLEMESSSAGTVITVQLPVADKPTSESLSVAGQSPAAA